MPGTRRYLAGKLLLLLLGVLIIFIVGEPDLSSINPSFSLCLEVRAKIASGLVDFSFPRSKKRGGGAL